MLGLHRGTFIYVVTTLLSMTAIASGQTKVEIINDIGAKGPCLGIGLGMALVPKCVARAEKEGFLKESEVGSDGLTIGTQGDEDGLVTAVATDSPAGIRKGDRIEAVDGKTAYWTPAMEVARQTFGERGKPVTLTVRSPSPAGSGPATRSITIIRDPAPMPANAPSGSLLLPLMPLVDWRGKFVPCTAAGPMTALTNAVCEKLFRPWNYIRAKESGRLGFTVDPAEKSAAVVQTVETASPAAKAGLLAGDTILEVDGKPLSGSAGELAQSYLFGPQGAIRVVSIDRDGQKLAYTMTLAKQTK